ncbi:MAG: hypothetical protein Q9219_002905 [cf. Caloplaca sp. 3 TL-2023]
MVSLVALIIWKIPTPFVILGFLTFGALDGVYLSSALIKVPDGAWFTLILAVLLSSVFVLWRTGKQAQWIAEESDLLPLSCIIGAETADQVANNGPTSPDLRFTAAFGRYPIAAINGMGIFFDKSGLANTTPAVFIHFIQKFQAAPKVIVFFHIRTLSSPSVPLEERFTVSRCSVGATGISNHQFFRIILRHGYTEEAISRNLGLQIFEQVASFIMKESVAEGPHPGNTTDTKLEGGASSDDMTGTPLKPPSGYEDQTCDSRDEIRPNASEENAVGQQDRIRTALSSLETAYHDQVVYIVGKEQMRVREVIGCKPRSWCRRLTLTAFLWLRSNTGSKVANLNVDVDKLVEIGFVKII